MNTAPSQALNAYTQVNLETAVNTANPVQLIVLLYDGAINSIASAKGMNDQLQRAEKGRLISKAIGIIEGLRSVLDKEKGGEIAINLNDLYEYMKKQLLLANLKNSPAQLDEVLRLLSDLRSAWVAIANPKATGAPAIPTQPPTHRGSVSYGKA